MKKRMVRKQIYIDSDQDLGVKEQAAQYGITEAEVIRRALGRQEALYVRDRPDPTVWAAERAFIQTRVETGSIESKSPTRTWSREDLYE